MPMMAALSAASWICSATMPAASSWPRAYAPRRSSATDVASASSASSASSRASAPSSSTRFRLSRRSRAMALDWRGRAASSALLSAMGLMALMLSPSIACVRAKPASPGPGKAGGPAAPSGDLERVLAALPVAGAQLVGLQRVERAQHFLDVAPDVEVVHAHPAHDPVRIHDIGRPQRHLVLRVQHAERLAQLLLVVRQHRVPEVLQVRVVLAPRQVHVLAVGADAVDLGPALAEVLQLAVELRDLGRAHEGEVHRPEKHHGPLVLQVLRADGREFLALLERHHGGHRKLRKLVSYA